MKRANVIAGNVDRFTTRLIQVIIDNNFTLSLDDKNITVDDLIDSKNLLVSDIKDLDGQKSVKVIQNINSSIEEESEESVQGESTTKDKPNKLSNIVKSDRVIILENDMFEYIAEKIESYKDILPNLIEQGLCRESLLIDILKDDTDVLQRFKGTLTDIINDNCKDLEELNLTAEEAQGYIDIVGVELNNYKSMQSETVTTRQW